MPEKIKQELFPEALPVKETFDLEKEVIKEKINTLSDEQEPGSFYRGVRAEDALRAIFGQLRLDANPRNDSLGTRDNASINLSEAVYFSRTSKTKTGKKFFCAIGFDPLSTTKVEDSYLGKENFVRVTGLVIAKEIIVRFAGKKLGSPAKENRHFSPREFCQWYQDNVG